MTTPPKVTLVTCSSMPHLFPGEEGLLDELASRGCDPQIKVWNDPDVDWSDAGMVVVRSVSDYAQDRAASWNGPASCGASKTPPTFSTGTRTSTT